MPFRKRFPDPQASCGSEIPRDITASRVRRTVWYARGVAQTTFADEILPDLKILLGNTGLGYGDLYLSIFMIGTRPTSATPTIMVTSLCESVRKEAVEAIKRSDVLKEHPEFGLGSSALPLNEPVPSRQLGGDGHMSSVMSRQINPLPLAFETNHRTVSSTETHVGASPQDTDCVIMATVPDRRPRIGRRLVIADAQGKPSRFATGGIVLQIGASYFQMTVGHIVGEEEDNSTLLQHDNLDYCDLDGQSSSEDEGSVLLPACEDTSRGSLSPAPETDSFMGSSGEDADAVMTDATCSSSASIGSGAIADLPTPQSAFEEQEASIGDDLNSAGNDKTTGFTGSSRNDPNMIRIGQIRYHSQADIDVSLDYSLVWLDAPVDLVAVNQIETSMVGEKKVLKIQAISPIPAMEKDIIVVTASGGVMHGKIIPSAVYLRRSMHFCFQKLFVVQFLGQVMEGDCGADVVDDQSGDLYGHIVRGCPGTQIAYMTAATDIFESLQKRFGLNPTIASDSTTGGSVGRSEAGPSQLCNVAGQNNHGNGQAQQENRSVLLACPFAKKDPITYEHCHDYELREIKHVKQHLKRCHLIVVCPRCRDGFGSHDLLDRHLLKGCKIRAREDPEGMTPKQHEILRLRTNKEISLEEQWYYIWETLFPGLPRPPTPYKDEFVKLSEFNKLMKDFRDHHIPSLASRLFNEMDNTRSLSSEQIAGILSRGMLEFDSTLLPSGVVNEKPKTPQGSGVVSEKPVNPHIRSLLSSTYPGARARVGIVRPFNGPRNDFASVQEQAVEQSSSDSGYYSLSDGYSLSGASSSSRRSISSSHQAFKHKYDTQLSRTNTTLDDDDTLSIDYGMARVLGLNAMSKVEEEPAEVAKEEDRDDEAK